MSIVNYIGNTPIVKINNPHGNQFGQVYVKLEEFNPAGSHKTRIALQMVEDAEVSGKLKGGSTILEATGGNTGIGLCLAAALKGYKIVLVIPEANILAALRISKTVDTHTKIVTVAPDNGISYL